MEGFSETSAAFYHPFGDLTLLVRWQEHRPDHIHVCSSCPEGLG